MVEALAGDALLRLGQHLGRDVDAGYMRVGAEIGQGQAGPDPDFEDALARPIIGDAHRFLAAGMEYRAKNNVVGSGKQTIGPDRVAQVHRIASRNVRGGRYSRPPRLPKVPLALRFFIPSWVSGKASRLRDASRVTDRDTAASGTGGPVPLSSGRILSRSV